MPSQESGDIRGNWWWRNNLLGERGKFSSRNNEARVNNTVIRTKYFSKPPADKFYASSSTVPYKTQPSDSLARLPYRFLVICDKTCCLNNYSVSYATTHLAISFYGLAIVKICPSVFASGLNRHWQRIGHQRRDDNFKNSPDSASLRIASSTNSTWARDDLLFLNAAGSGKLRKGSIYPEHLTVWDLAGVAFPDWVW